MVAVFCSAKNHVAMSLCFERDEFGDDLVLPVSEEVGMIHEAEMFLISFRFGKVHPEEFRNELLAGLVGDKE